MFSRYETKHGPIHELLWLITIMVGFLKKLIYNFGKIFQQNSKTSQVYNRKKIPTFCQFFLSPNKHYHLLDVWGQYDTKLIV
jgi:hypothetical protein